MHWRYNCTVFADFCADPRPERLITRSMLLPALECAQKPRTLQQCCFVEASCCSNVKECCIARVRRCRCLGTVMDVICLFASAAGLAVAEIRAGSRRDGHTDKGRAHAGRIFSKGLLRTTRRDIRGHDSGVAKGRHHNTPESSSNCATGHRLNDKKGSFKILKLLDCCDAFISHVIILWSLNAF